MRFASDQKKMEGTFALPYNQPRLAFLLALLVCVSSVVVNGNIAEHDDYWKMRAEAARNASLDSYHSDPFNVTNHFNYEVHREEDGNSTRRNLGRYTGSCMATNPIDRCWRCDPLWSKHRKRLADCALGFGRKAYGGKRGRYYVVTDPSDDDLVNPEKGTLRYGAIQDRPLWIIFKTDMVIRLSEELIINSFKTIDGRGANVHIAYGAGFTIQFVNHVIIHGLHIHDIKAGGGGLIRDSQSHFGLRTRSDGDGISIFGSTNIWIDHNSMSNCMDGIIDAIQGSTAITISNNHFTRHNEVILMGAHDDYSGDAIMQVTFAFNHFGRNLVQRMPRCRWGFFHVVNNDYTHWQMYAIGGSQHPTIISEGNRFVAPPIDYAKEVTKREYAPQSVWSQWTWSSSNDYFQNGAFFRGSGRKFKNPYTKAQKITPKPGTFVSRLTRFAGALNCKKLLPC
ncbi:Pectate lyase [Nymphaea thermarum]|nr:Pectate lyase [Nymphaea thermarum]